jgi:hypothetical protein
MLGSEVWGPILVPRFGDRFRRSVSALCFQLGLLAASQAPQLGVVGGRLEFLAQDRRAEEPTMAANG